MKFLDAPLYARQIIIISFIIALVLSIIGLFSAIRLCKKKRFIVPSALTFVASFITLLLTMRGSYLHMAGRPVFEPSLAILKLPLWSFCVWSVLLFGSSVAEIVLTAKWSKKHVSPVSVKESADTLPAGLCFYEESGLVRLVNTEMNRLCVLATGKALLDGVTFWRKVSQGELEENCLSLKTGEGPIVEFKDGKAVSFKRYCHNIDDKTVYEIVAVDITERYVLTKEAEQKQTELKSINKRLMSYGENAVQLVKEKELLAAKIRIHDDMGKILIATRRRLGEDLSISDEKQLLRFWQTETEALKYAKADGRKSNLQVIEEAAKLVGVKIVFDGEKPKDETTEEKILVGAMHECLTNTVSHADGKTMTVKVQKENGVFIFKITNDGKQPLKDIAEGGGLSGLRTLVEREGGKMTVKSVPQFELTIELFK